MTKTNNVIAFPVRRMIFSSVPRAGSLVDEQMDRVSELLAERAKRIIREWQAAEGMPDESVLLVRRLTCLMRCPEGISEEARTLLVEAVSAREVEHA